MKMQDGNPSGSKARYLAELTALEAERGLSDCNPYEVSKGAFRAGWKASSEDRSGTWKEAAQHMRSGGEERRFVLGYLAREHAPALAAGAAVGTGGTLATQRLRRKGKYQSEQPSKVAKNLTPITKPIPSYAPQKASGVKVGGAVAKPKAPGGQSIVQTPNTDRLNRLKGILNPTGVQAPATAPAGGTAPAVSSGVGKADQDDKFEQLAREQRRKRIQPSKPGSMIGSVSGNGALAQYRAQKESQARLDKIKNMTPEEREARTKSLKRSMKRGAGAAGGIVGFFKAEPLKTSISERDADRVVRRYGLKGPLPKELTREQKMNAYEARYVNSGGRKGEKWQRRAENADKVKNVGLGVATLGGGAWLGARTKAGAKMAGKVTPKVKHHADTIAVAGATAGGAGEIYAGHARRKRSSYASAPGGVAASALRRMRDYTKEP